MMRLTVADGAASRTVLVPVEDSTTLGELVNVLELDEGRATLGEAGQQLIADTTLINGSTLPPTLSDALPVGTARLEVVGGPFSGRAVPLSEEQPLLIGSGRTVMPNCAAPSKRVA